MCYCYRFVSFGQFDFVRNLLNSCEIVPQQSLWSFTCYDSCLEESKVVEFPLTKFVRDKINKLKLVFLIFLLKYMSSIVSNETIIYGHRRRIGFIFEFHSTGATTGNYFIEYSSQLMPCRLFICFVIKTCTTYTYIIASPTRQTFVCHCLRRINAHQTNRSKNI